VRLLHTIPTTDALTHLPTVLIPAFGVPLFLMLHAVSLARLRDPRPMAVGSGKAAAAPTG
jgi:hypothetical protein